MRTTLTLDNDVAELARQIAAQTGRAVKQVMNEALRTGLRDMSKKPEIPAYRTNAHGMGLQPGISLDNIQELLAQVEGEEAR